ncbi:hypothetical protein LMG29542_07574 [Paraburkholderia humisilvae]|uniref:Uncharacterized protein n=1 Tax=Paraburkholderia humisilvae TaxID=627669 RepID=A0A6J5F5G0_9BURK|nr:hypothetical protein LMG29542_07574 [Paraburkholderia humisilvae]
MPQWRLTLTFSAPKSAFSSREWRRDGRAQAVAPSMNYPNKGHTYAAFSRKLVRISVSLYQFDQTAYGSRVCG